MIRRASQVSSVHPMQACSSISHVHTPSVQSRGRFASRHASMRRNWNFGPSVCICEYKFLVDGFTWVSASKFWMRDLVLQYPLR